MPQHDAERLREVIRLLQLDPYFGDIQKMRGEEDTWRRRVGNYRLFYRVKTPEGVILAFHLERRKSKTYRHR
ncbi:MAG: type II toxin-antitoxin system RelE/ParE family toxin [bacterium]|nr:type II toxin-antitoxin system RelE/ParE family toxin [bacterium]